MRALAFAHWHTREQATFIANLLAHDAGASGAAQRERLFIRWWQRTFDDYAGGDVVQPWVNELHHDLLDLLQHEVGTTSARLPCRSCGRIFESHPPRFARQCNACGSAKPYEPRTAVHVNGVSRPFYAPAVYPQGPTAAEAWWHVLCEHPDCLTVFPTANRLTRYCGSHSRASAQRARERDATPKPRRFRFRLADEVDGEPLRSVTFTGREGRQIELVPGETYTAGDLDELCEFAVQLGRGVVELA